MSKMRLIAASLFCAASAIQAAPSAILTLHVPAAVANGQARLIGHLPPGQHLALAISLPLHHDPELDDLLQHIYDPRSADYRHYLSVDEFAGRFGPSTADHEAVVRFATAAGLTVTGTRPSRLVVDLEGPVAKIEQALHVTMGIYQHPSEPRAFFAPDREPALDLAVPVLHISGLDNCSLPAAKHVTAAPGASRNSTGSEIGRASCRERV